MVDVNKALVTRLSDGASWNVAAEPGDAFVLPLWVDDDEVWLSTEDLAYFGHGDFESSIVRIARSSLGDPTSDAGR